jgi:N-acetylneuraminic acid mutarotase
MDRAPDGSLWFANNGSARYDPATNTWSAKAMMPFGGDHCNAAATATKLYVLGATGTTQSAEYDPVANSWTTKRPIPTQRAAAATAAIGDKIYVAGGMSTMGRNVTVREFAAYDAVTDTWEILPDLPDIQRNHGPAAAVGGILYLLGGRSGPPNNPTEGLLDRVDAYDPATRMWSSKAAMPRARGGTSAGVIGGLIVVVGGEGNNVAVNAMRVFPETDVFDPVANSWRTVAPMRTPRHGMGAAVVGNVLYVPGGATAQGGGTAVAILEAFSF